jgi:anti-sigma regulatory factor (Ser/Thr protein kinase)
VMEITFTREHLTAIRRIVGNEAESAALEASRARDLVLAVNELTTNSVYHGGGLGTLRIWHEPQALICEVHDGGLIEEPLVGRERPRVDSLTGRGLWLVNQVCDLVQIRTSPRGSTIRVHMQRGVPGVGFEPTSPLGQSGLSR